MTVAPWWSNDSLLLRHVQLLQQVTESWIRFDKCVTIVCIYLKYTEFKLGLTLDTASFTLWFQKAKRNLDCSYSILVWRVFVLTFVTYTHMRSHKKCSGSQFDWEVFFVPPITTPPHTPYIAPFTFVADWQRECYHRAQIGEEIHKYMLVCVYCTT